MTVTLHGLFGETTEMSDPMYALHRQSLLPNRAGEAEYRLRLARGEVLCHARGEKRCRNKAVGSHGLCSRCL